MSKESFGKYDFSKRSFQMSLHDVKNTDEAERRPI